MGVCKSLGTFKSGLSLWVLLLYFSLWKRRRMGGHISFPPLSELHRTYSGRSVAIDVVRT